MAEMRYERRSGSDERRITTAMIVDKVVLGRVASRWRPEGLFSSPWANMVGGWAVDYHRTYGAAPGQAIEGLFEAWAEGGDKAASAPGPNRRRLRA